MFIKASITTIIAAMLAGGVVYYGMPDGSTGSVPINQADAGEPVKKKWMDKYLKPKPAENDTPSKPAEETQNQIKTDQEATKPDAVTDLEGTEEFDGLKIVDNGEAGTRYFLYENGELREIDELPTQIVDVEVPGETGPISVSKTAREKFLVASRQSKLIEQPELKDQAVIDMIDYALVNGLFQDAESAVNGINQAELRDTARSRIANTYALQGRSKDAFRMIEKVEVEALRDVMRLQAIQALIVPERLPQPMQ